jgi:uncharacterized membrane protein YkvA (DUF1232 family)
MNAVMTAHGHLRMMSAVEPYHARARQALRDTAFVEQTLVAAGDRAASSPTLTHALGPLRGLVEAHLAGDYRRASTDDVAWALAAAMYVVSPWDETPDYLPTGLRDDELVAETVLELIAETIEDYRAWEHQRRPRRRVPPGG